MIRLSDEAMLVELAEAVAVYYKRVGDDRACASVNLMIIEHLYYKHDTVAAAVQKAHAFNKKFGNFNDLHPACKSKIDIDRSNVSSSTIHPGAYMGNPSVDFTPINNEKKVDSLCQFIFKNGDEQMKTRALLCSVYHHALHDRYYRAKDMFLISHIQDMIEKMDVKTQILYNRALVALGLAAFRLGLINKAHDCLSGICNGRPMELLAQRTSIRYHERDPEQEKLERRRQVPYHMHINPELIECCHLTSAMLLELPHLAKGTNTDKRISKQFRNYLMSYDRQDFTGPPENTREHVLAASKALMAGEWKRACDYILGLDLWNLIPGDGGIKVKEMLRQRMKEEAVRIYLLTYGAHYDSIALSHICVTFDMDEATARRIISRMLFDKEISGAWDLNNILILYNIDPSTLQQNAQVLADAVSTLVQSNENIVELLVSPATQSDWPKKSGQWDDRNDNRKRMGGFKYNKNASQARLYTGNDRKKGGKFRTPVAGRPNPGVVPGRSANSRNKPANVWGTKTTGRG